VNGDGCKGAAGWGGLYSGWLTVVFCGNVEMLRLPDWFGVLRYGLLNGETPMLIGWFL
jgi:hypothetical protein